MHPHQVQIDSLRKIFEAVDYTTESVMAVIGEDGQLGLGRNSTTPALVHLEDNCPAEAAKSGLCGLIKLWVLQREVEANQLPEGLDLSWLVKTGIVQQTGAGKVKALLDIRPYGEKDDLGFSWVVSDPVPGMDGEITATKPDYVLGVSPASTTLAQLSIRKPVGRALDLGTGCAVQSLHLARHCEQVVATDLNPRALECASMSAALSKVEVDFRLGSLYEPVVGEKFDLIVTNPPYVMSPPKEGGKRLVYRESGFESDQLVASLVKQCSDYLNPGGTLQVLANWAHTAGVNYQDRLASWVPQDCDGLFLQREVLSLGEYIEMWLTDAGLAGQASWPQHYRHWLEYFDSLGVEKVGMGWIEIQKHTGKTNQVVEVEDWPWAVGEDLGSGFLAAQRGRELNRLSDAEILAKHWVIADDVIVETTGKPGEVDPEHIVFRSASGFKRALKVSTALGGVLGACDGELSLAVIIEAISNLLDRDSKDIFTETQCGIREAIRYGMLVPLAGKNGCE